MIPALMENDMRNSNEPDAREEAIRQQHQEFVKNYTVELYLLDELTQEERAQFEEHYFECEPCAEAVEAGQAFVSGIRPVKEHRVINRFWLPTSAVAATLLSIVIGQQYVIANSKGPQPNTVILARKIERGPTESAYLAKTPSVTVEVNLSGEARFAYYRMKIQSDKHYQLSQVVPAPPDESEERLSIQFARRMLGTGHFTVQLQGLESEESTNGTRLGEAYAFDLK